MPSDSRGMRSPHSTTYTTDEFSAQPPPYQPIDMVPTAQGPAPIIVAVADRFLDDTSQSRHQQQQHRVGNSSFNQVDTLNTGRPGVIVVDATPMPLSRSHSQSGCLTKRQKIIICIQLPIMAIVFIVMSQTVWKHDSGSSGNGGGGNDNSNRDISPASGSTSTGPKQPEPSRNPDKPWLPCSPGCCLNFRVGCQDSCEATDLTYKSCVASCGGNTTCEFACGRRDKPCFSTYATKHGMCREECKQ